MCPEVLHPLPGMSMSPGLVATVQSDPPEDKGPGQDAYPHPTNKLSAPGFISTSRAVGRGGWQRNGKCQPSRLQTFSVRVPGLSPAPPQTSGSPHSQGRSCQASHRRHNPTCSQTFPNEYSLALIAATCFLSSLINGTALKDSGSPEALIMSRKLPGAWGEETGPPSHEARTPTHPPQPHTAALAGTEHPHCQHSLHQGHGHKPIVIKTNSETGSSFKHLGTLCGAGSHRSARANPCQTLWTRSLTQPFQAAQKTFLSSLSSDKQEGHRPSCQGHQTPTPRHPPRRS